VQDEESAALLAGWGVDRLQGQLSGEATLDVAWASTREPPPAGPRTPA
jgi:hypothetical protein